MFNHVRSAKFTLTFLVLVLMSGSRIYCQTEDEIKTFMTGKEKRLEWMETARFGMFIHWGVYSGISDEWNGKRGDGESCFMMEHFKIPYQEYLDKIAKAFNPIKFDAEEWVKIAKQAGMKYIVITAKHVDGFAMYHSEASPYNIVDGTAYKNDPILALRKACDKYGMKLGYYYCQTWDWLHPHALAPMRINNNKDNYWDWPDQAQKNTDIYYQEKAYKQIDELMKNYKPDLIWFDVPGLITKEQSFNLLKIIRSQNPNCIINNRIGNGMGDYLTPEQYIPAGSKEFFEVCMTMQDHWGYSFFDRNGKSTKTIIQNLVDIAHKGGNFLLNVGPTGEGVIPELSVRTLQGVGEWIEKYGESIYGSSGSPLAKLPFSGRCTAKPGKLFIHIFDWTPSRELVIPGIKSNINKIYLLADQKKSALNFEKLGSDVKISLSAASLSPSMIDENCTVLVIELKDKLETEEKPMLIDPAYISTLSPNEALIEGKQLKYQFNNQWGTGRGYHLNSWYLLDDLLNWEIRSIRDGSYDVEVTYSAAKGCDDNQFSLSVGEEMLTATVNDTGGWNSNKTFLIGSIRIKKNDKTKLTIKPVKLGGCSLMDLKSVMLIPILK